MCLIELGGGYTDYTKLLNLPTLGTASTKDVATSGDASANQVVMGNDTRLTNARPASDVSSWAKASTKPTYTASEVGAYTKTESDNKYVAKETGKGLSTNDYTTADKNKLTGIEAEANKTVVDSAMSDSSTNPLQNKVITKELEGAKTTSGNPITVTDAAPVNAVNLSVDLEPVQDLHGYDHPWVGGAGKNKLPMTVAEIKAANDAGSWEGNVYNANGVYFTILTDSDGNVTGIKVNGTASANTDFNLSTSSYATLTSIGLISGTSYIVNGCPQGGSFSDTYSLIFNAGNTSNKYDLGSGFNITVNSTDTYKIQVYIHSGYTANNLILYPMIRLSTETDSSFAPYTNICPISGRSEETIERVGKNLVEDKLVGARLYSSGSIGSDSRFSMQLARVKSGVQYTVTTDEEYLVGGYFTSKPTVGSVTYDGTIIDTESKTFTATIDGWLAFRTSANYSTPQLELGNQATTYEPYTSDTYTIQIGQDVYGAQYDVTRGKMVVDKIKQNITNAMVFSKRNTADSNKYRWAFVPNPAIRLSGIYDIDVISNALAGVKPYGTYGQQETRKEYSISGDTNDNFINIYLTGSGDRQELTDFLNNNDVYCVYELATPFTIDLTPQQIKMLENTNTISTDYEGDTITLEYQPNNAIGEAVRVVEENYETRVSLLEDLNSPNAGFHNSIYRGKNLGTSVTTSQWLAIKNGTFEDLFIGDYWTINNIVWRIAAFDYWMGVGENEYKTTKHHIVIVPDQYLVSGGYPMNTSETTAGGYIATQMHTQTIPQVIDPIVENAFGASHIMQHSEMITDQVTDGKSSKYAWVNGIKSELMNEIAVYGSRIFGSSGYDSGNAKGQLPLFRLNPGLMILNSTDHRKLWWLRDVYDAGYFCYVNGNGYADKHRASNTYIPIRPYFSIYQNSES